MRDIYDYCVVNQLRVINGDAPESLLASPQGSYCAGGEARACKKEMLSLGQLREQSISLVKFIFSDEVIG